MSTKTLLIVLLPCLLQQQCLGRNEDSSTLAQLDDCTCLGYNQIFECTVFGGGFTYWQGTAFSDCQRNEIQLRHSEYNNTGPHQATGDCNGGKIMAKSIGVSGKCYTSQLNVSIEQEIINETINCIHSDTQHVTTTIGQIVLSLTQEPYPPPSNIHVEAIEWNRIVFAWNKTTSIKCSSVQYVITTINCGVCPNTTTHTNITCRIQFNISNHTCLFAVQTKICGHLVGTRSDYVIINLFVPSPPKFKLRLHYSSQYTAIETVFPIAQNMMISENIDGSPISYNITYSDFNSGRICGVFSIPAATCQDGVCRQKSQIASPCSPNEDVSVIVLSTNILGSGPASQPVVFSLIMNNDHNVTNSTVGRSETTCELLVIWVATILSTLLIITVVIVVLIIVAFTVVTIKLLRDKANMKQVIKAISSEQDLRNSTAEKELATCSGDYEDVDTYKASTMNINENAAYSTVTDL